MRASVAVFAVAGISGWQRVGVNQIYAHEIDPAQKGQFVAEVDGAAFDVGFHVGSFRRHCCRLNGVFD